MTNTSIQRFTSGLEYGITSSAPATISRVDIAKWKSRVSPDVAHHFVERHEALHREYQTLIESYELNRLVYTSEMNFEPVVGQIYYVYEKGPNRRCVSLVSPTDAFWSGFLCAVRLTASYVWESVPVPARA